MYPTHRAFRSPERPRVRPRRHNAGARPALPHALLRMGPLRDLTHSASIVAVKIGVPKHSWGDILGLVVHQRLGGPRRGPWHGGRRRRAGSRAGPAARVPDEGRGDDTGACAEAGRRPSEEIWGLVVRQRLDGPCRGSWHGGRRRRAGSGAGRAARVPDEGRGDDTGACAAAGRQSWGDIWGLVVRQRLGGGPRVPGAGVTGAGSRGRRRGCPG